MLFSNSANTLQRDILIDGTKINISKSTKFLGLYIDNKLSWKIHVDYVSKIVSRNIGVINKLKIFLPKNTLLSLYNTLILSYINYGILAWGNCSQESMNRLLLLQKRALRIINHSPYLAHIDPLFHQYKALKVNDIYRLQLGVFMFQLTKNELPNCITTMFSKNIDFHTYFTRQACQFHLPQTQTQLSRKSIKFEGPKPWNSLDKSLKNYRTVTSFKRNLKGSFLNTYCSV